MAGRAVADDQPVGLQRGQDPPGGRAVEPAGLAQRRPWPRPPEPASRDRPQQPDRPVYRLHARCGQPRARVVWTRGGPRRRSLPTLVPSRRSLLDVECAPLYVRIINGGVRMANETGPTPQRRTVLASPGLPVLRHRGRRGRRRIAPRGVRRTTQAAAAASRASGGMLIHGATGGSSKDTLDAHRPVQRPTSRACSNLYEPLLFWDNDYKLAPALAESRRAVGRRDDLDDQAAPGRHLPQRQGRHPRGRAVHDPARGRPQGPDLGRRRALAPIIDLDAHQEGRRQHAS